MRNRDVTKLLEGTTSLKLEARFVTQWVRARLVKDMGQSSMFDLFVFAAARG